MENGLEIVGREDVDRQQHERDAVAPDDGRRNGKDFCARAHKDVNVKLGEQLAQPCPEGGENHRRAEREVQCLPDALKDRVYYQPTDEGAEARVRQRKEQIDAWRKERRASLARSQKQKDREGEHTDE